MTTKLVSTGVEFPDSTTQTTEGVTNVTAGNALTGGGSGSSVTINHADTSSQGSVSNSGSTVIQDVTLDDYGHITGLSSTTISASPTTADVGNAYGGLAAGAVGTYTSGYSSSLQNVSKGQLVSGSTLRVTEGGAGNSRTPFRSFHDDRDNSTSLSMSGTWRAMSIGVGSNPSFTVYRSYNLFLRIS
jgi:hypothetical protein